MLEAFQQRRFRLGHALLAVPEQVHVHIGHALAWGEAPEFAGGHLVGHHMLGQTADAVTGADRERW